MNGELSTVPRNVVWRLCMALGLLVGIHLSPASANEVEERAAMRNEVAMAWYRNNIAELEAHGERLRSTRALTPSGVWKLTHYYAALQQILASSNSSSAENRADDELLEGWQRTYPESPAPVIARAMLAKMRAGTAKKFVAADRPPLAGWQPDVEYISDAREILERRKLTASRDPHWYVVMTQVLHEQGATPAEIILLHQEATALEPGYDATHFAAMTTISELLSAFPDRIEQFANTVRQAVGGIRGDEAYARLYMNYYQARFDPKTFHKSGVAYLRLKAGIEQVVAAYPIDWNVSHYALFACVYGDHSAVATMFAKLGSSPVREVWKHPMVFDSCKRMATRR
jgi:hypothetical protein